MPPFLIISSSVYPAIISGIQNKEMALMVVAVAQLQESSRRSIVILLVLKKEGKEKMKGSSLGCVD